MAREDRADAEARYVAGTQTLKQLAAEMGISESTLARWCKQGEWAKKRAAANESMVKGAVKKVMNRRQRELEKLIDASGLIEQSLMEAARQMCAAITEQPKQTGKNDKVRWLMADGYRAKNLESLTNAIAKATETRMKLAGMLEESERQKIALAKKRLKIEETRIENGKDAVQEDALRLQGDIRELAE